MNDYRITNTIGAESGTITAIDEQDARRIYRASHKGPDARIEKVELVRENVPATKQQERDALETIRKIVASLGPQSYLATAFEGCFQDAEDNIDDDAAYSMKARYESSEEKLREMAGNYNAAKRDATVLREQLEAALESIKALERRQISERLRGDLWAMVTDEAKASRARMAKSADMIVVCSDNPGCVGFVESVADYRKEKKRAEAMEKRAAELAVLEPERK